MRHTPNDTIYKLLEDKEELLEACKNLVEEIGLHEVANKGTDRVKSYIVSKSAVEIVKRAISRTEGQ